MAEFTTDNNIAYSTTTLSNTPAYYYDSKEGKSVTVLDDAGAGIRLLTDGNLLFGKANSKDMYLYNPVNKNGVVTAALGLGQYTGSITDKLWSITMPSTGATIDNFTAGLRSYELKDHLGNVRVVVTDKLKDDPDGGKSPEVKASYQYYAFGSPMPHRYGNANLVGTSGSYRYGFNGKEKDDNLTGKTGAIYDYGARFYDARLGRWMSVDPLAHRFSAWSPFTYCNNNPIRLIDPDGKAPTPAEAARMAAHVYGDKKDNILIGGWRVSKSNFGIKLQDETSLRSLVYERVVGNKVTEYVYATAGSVEGKDWAANAIQPLGLSDQYHSAAENAKTLSSKLGNTELNFVGHSLGGGEAALNSLVTSNENLIGRKAFTFNAAGVGDITKIAEGTWKTPFKSEKNINAYILITDPLNFLQNSSPAMPDVNGNRSYLFPKDLPSTYNGHSIDNIIKNFGVNPDKYKK